MPRRAVAPALGLCLGLLALGPGLQRGFLLSYDMVFVPREPLLAALPGLAPPRAVPSDLVVALASRVIPADITQKLLLLSIFVLACAGMAALLENQPMLARLAAGAYYCWNPYVAERLIIGQWALLLGYAALPWVLRAVRAGRPLPLCLAVLPAVIGGFAALAVTARAIDAAPGPGTVLLLPWAADRRPAWNGGEAMLDPWPRLLVRPVIWNDGTQVGDVRLAPDDPRAIRLNGVVQGRGPLSAALLASGVRFVLVDAGPLPGARLLGATIIIDQPGLVVYQLAR